MVLLVVSYNPAELMAANPAYWADAMGIQVQGGRFVFGDREYQVQPMCDCSRVKTWMKGTQVGGTEAELITNFHGLIHGRYPSGVMYVFPGESDVTDFSKTRATELISRNKLAIGQFVGNINAAGVRKIGNGYLYARFASLNQNIQGIAKQSKHLRSTPVDKIVYEEFDLHDPEAEEQAESRKGASDVDESVYISNPTVPDYGIHRKYEQSDQRHRWIKCPKCNKFTTCLELSFPECVLERHGKTYYGCIKCGTELNRRQGEWVAHERGNEFPGWWISRFQSLKASGDAARIIARFRHPDLDIANFYRMVWGKPYVDASHRLTPQMVYECCGPDAMQSRSTGPCAMGVDVGKVLNVVIGRKIGEKARQILWVGRVDGFEDLHDLGKWYNVQCCGIDFEPETRMCRKFRDQEPYPVYLIDYADRTVKVSTEDEQAGVVRVGRTELCDETHNLIANQLVELPRKKHKEIELFAKQCAAMVKFIQDTPSGKVRGRYVKTGDGQDHYRHALGYFQQACEYLPVYNPASTRHHSKKDDHGTEDLLHV